MRRPLRLLAAFIAALVLGALTMHPAFAATPPGSPTPTPSSDPSQQLPALEQQLQQQLATLNSLTSQEDSEQATVSRLDSKVSADQQREKTLNRRLDRVERIEYERPALTLVTVMQARNLGQLLTGVAQARVVSQQQQALLNAATALKASDQQDQSAAQAQLTKISAQKTQASSIAASTRSEIATLQAQQAAQQAAAQQAAAQQQAAQQSTSTTSTSTAAAPAPAPASSGSVQAIIEAAFASLGSTAQQWGLCIAQHESGDNPSAVQPGAGGAEGLFQFEPSTWTGTPEGQAGDSIFDATASSEAAAWEYSRGNYSAWTTNADFCSMYD